MPQLDPIATIPIADVSSAQSADTVVAVVQQVYVAISCGAISL
jgi:hypothetical protein